MSLEALLASVVISSVLASLFFALTRVLDAMNGSGIGGRAPLVPAVKAIVKSIEPQAGKMVIADPQEWT